MPYQHEWLINNQVLYVKLWGEQTLEEMQDANKQLIALLNGADGRVIHMVTDASELVGSPLSVFESRRYLTYTNHINLGWTILFGAKGQSLSNATRQYLATTFVKLSRSRYVRVATFDEAVAHLIKVDSFLDWDKINLNIHGVLAAS